MRWLLMVMVSLLAIALMNRVARAEEPLPLLRVKPLEPADALKSFRCQHGFEMQLLAAEPFVTKVPTKCIRRESDCASA